MDHTGALRHLADTYFQASIKLPLERLLAPISADHPAGEWLHNSQTYRAIERARSADDASLPLGAWERELKRADWPAVSHVSADVLCLKSKDIKCVAWLLEARLHLDGFAAIAPCLTLLDLLLNQYWDSIYPLPDGDNFELRASQIDWIGARLVPAVRQTPLMRDEAGEASARFNWADREQAQRHKQLIAHLGNSGPQIDGTLAMFEQGVAATSTKSWQQLQQTLSTALQALAVLEQTLAARFGHSAPDMASLRTLLDQILAFSVSVLQHRDAAPAQAEPAPAEELQQVATQAAAAPATAWSSPIRDLDDAYAKLAELSDYLMRAEPRSPTPYLLRRAVEWSKLDTAQLYQEIFIRSNGTLNIFELLGLDAPDGVEQQ